MEPVVMFVYIILEGKHLNVRLKSRRWCFPRLCFGPQTPKFDYKGNMYRPRWINLNVMTCRMENCSAWTKRLFERSSVRSDFGLLCMPISPARGLSLGTIKRGTMCDLPTHCCYYRSAAWHLSGGLWQSRWDISICTNKQRFLVPDTFLPQCFLSFFPQPPPRSSWALQPYMERPQRERSSWNLWSTDKSCVNMTLHRHDVETKQLTGSVW